MDPGISHYSPIDIVLSILVSALMGLATIAWFFLRDRWKRQDADVATATAAATANAQSIALLQQTMANVGRTAQETVNKASENTTEIKLLQQKQEDHEERDDARFDGLNKKLDKNTDLTIWIGDSITAMRTGDPMPQRPATK